ncbi:MAG: hypothetical protein ACXWM6_12935, partial [Thermodesulfobacteriota bacterium]
MELEHSGKRLAGREDRRTIQERHEEERERLLPLPAASFWARRWPLWEKMFAPKGESPETAQMAEMFQKRLSECLERGE